MKHINNEEISKTERLSKYSSMTDQDILSLSLYIKTVYNNIDTINTKLSLTIGNRSIFNSKDVINESENDADTQPHTTSNSVNPYKRNCKPKEKHTMLLLSSYLKDKPINFNLLNKTSITEDSLRELSSLKQKPNKSFNKKDQSNHPKYIFNRNILYKASEHKQEKNAFLPLIRKGFQLKIKPAKKNHIIIKTLSKVKEELNSMTKLKHKSLISNTNMLKDSIKLINNINMKQTEQNEDSEGMAIKKRVSLKKNEVNTSNDKIKKNFSIIKKLPDYINDNKSLTEMFLLLNEISLLNSAKYNQSSNSNQLNYLNDMKDSYLIRNSDSDKTASFFEAYVKDKKSLSAILIQKHWRKWKVKCILSSNDNIISLIMPHKRENTRKSILMNAKNYFFNNILNKDKDYKEMICMLNKANECYSNCLNNKEFVNLKNMVLTDFKMNN